MKTLLISALLSLSALSVAHAETADRFTPAQKAQMENLLQQRFATADANQDGQVTREEAKGIMPRVYRHFERIDADHSGAVTLDEIHQAIDVLVTQTRR